MFYLRSARPQKWQWSVFALILILAAIGLVLGIVVFEHSIVLFDLVRAVIGSELILYILFVLLNVISRAELIKWLEESQGLKKGDAFELPLEDLEEKWEWWRKEAYK